MATAPQYQVIVVVDIEGFGKRRNPIQHWLRERLYEITGTAMTESGIDVSQGCHSDRGDGAFWLFPASVSKVDLSGCFVRVLRDLLVAHSRISSEEAALRLRLVLHAGEVARDEHGWVGADLNTACRLVDLQVLRDVLAAAPTSALVLAVTDSWYSSVIRHDYPGVERDEFRAVPFVAKEVRQWAWLRVPGLDQPPGIGSEKPSVPTGPPSPGEVPSTSATGMNTGPFAGAQIQAGQVYGGNHNEYRARGGPE